MIFYSHIESYEHLNYGHIESEINIQVPEHKRDPWNLEFPVWICVCNNPDTVPASQHKQVFSDSLYLVPLFPLGFIRPCI